MNLNVLFVSFFLSQFVFSAKLNYVFDLSGTFHGYGDIVGPWSALYGLKKKRPNANYIGIVDSRARDILEDTYKKPLAEISKDFGVVFYSEQSPEMVPKADVYFQLFFGGRRIKNYEDYGVRDFINPYFCDSNTVTIVSDTMHGSTLDEAIGPGFTLYFKPPGIGTGRSGILDSTDLDKLVNLAPLKQKELAASLFEEPILKQVILSAGLFQGVKLSFMYGLHNEAIIGQSADFLEGLAAFHTKGPVVVLSPQEFEVLKKLVPDSIRILTLSDLKSVAKLDNRVYVVQLPSISNFQFSALIASADLPILLEGNNAISQAIRLQKEFLVLRSGWNKAQIEDLIDVDSELGGPWIYPGIYNLSNDSKPRFRAWFKQQEKSNWLQRFYQQYALSKQVPDFVDKLNEVIGIASALRKSGVTASQIRGLTSQTKDEYLAYSAIRAVDKSAPVPQGVDVKRMRPNRPNSTLKMELVQPSSVDYYVVNLKRSPERRAYMEKQFSKIEGIKPQFVEAVDGKVLAKHPSLKPGELGIFETTRNKVLPLASKGGISVVFEDDVVLPKSLPADLNRILREAPSNWDLIYLGCNENVFANSQGQTSSVQNPEFNYNLCPSSDLGASKNEIKKILSDRCIAGTWAYLVNRRSAQKLLRLLDAGSMDRPIDNQLSRFTGEGKINSYCVSPQIVWPNDMIESTIR